MVVVEAHMHGNIGYKLNILWILNSCAPEQLRTWRELYGWCKIDNPFQSWFKPNLRRIRSFYQNTQSPFVFIETGKGCHHKMSLFSANPFKPILGTMFVLFGSYAIADRNCHIGNSLISSENSLKVPQHLGPALEAFHHSTRWSNVTFSSIVINSDKCE